MMQEERISRLEEEVAFLKSELRDELNANRVKTLCSSFGLARQMVEVLEILFDAYPRVVGSRRIEEMLPLVHDISERKSDKVVHVRIHQLRKAIGRDVIETAWGHGYRLTPKGRATVEQALNSRHQAAA